MSSDTIIPNHDSSLRLVKFTVLDDDELDDDKRVLTEFFPLIAWALWQPALSSEYHVYPITTVGRVTGSMDEDGICFGLVMHDGRVSFFNEEWFDDVAQAARAVSRHWRRSKDESED